MNQQLSENEVIKLIATNSRKEHSLRLGKFMEQLAKYFNEDVQEWKLVGLLHDLDYDETEGEREKHGIITAQKLEGKLSEKALRAIMSHDHRTGITPVGRLGNLLRAADALDIFIEDMVICREEISAKKIMMNINTNKSRKPWLIDIIKSCIKYGISLQNFIDIRLDIFSKRNY